jgi:hypothetical protein
MIKNFALLLTAIISLNAFGAYTPLSSKGQLETVKVPTVNLEVPNKLSTKTGNSTVLLESGNKNLLENPSFEHSTISTAWSMSGGVLSAETTNVIDGKQSAKIVSSVTSIELQQDSTLYASQITEGLQGYLSVKVKTTTAGLYVCPTRAGGRLDVIYCSYVNPDGAWGSYRIPFILGATSNGISINSQGNSFNGTVYIDDAYVGIADPSVTTDVIGPWVDYGEISVSAATTAPTKQTTRQTDKVRCRVVGTDYECTYTYAAAAGTGGAIGSGEYIFSLPSGIEFDTTRVNLVPGTLGVGYTSGQGVIGFGYLSYGGNGRGDVSIIASTATTFRVIARINAGHEAFGSAEGSGAWTSANSSFKFIIKFPGLGLKVNSSVFVTSSDFFDSNTAPLTFKSTALNANDPEGTFNTFSYAAGGNTKTRCATAPTQSISSMRDDGFLIYTRVFANASTCADPARFEIRVGPDKKALLLRLFKSTGEVNPGEVDFFSPSSTSQAGIRYKQIDELTGILTLDTGNNTGSGITSNNLHFGDNTTGSSGYLKVFAQKAKSFIAGAFKEVITSPGLNRPVVVGASVSDTEVITENSSSFITSCTNADPSVCTVTTSFFSSDPLCWANPTTSGVISAVTLDTSTSITIDRTDASTAFKLFCLGVIP